jgi:acyl carrier protein
LFALRGLLRGTPRAHDVRVGPFGPVCFGIMNSLSRSQVRDLMAQVMKNQGKVLPDDDSADLREIGFRSLDFSELALRVEDEIGEELNFDAPGLRQIATVGDVLDFIVQLQSE